ncbi:MAG: GIY-YIG nuclease family protein [Bacteroidales bacterium]
MFYTYVLYSRQYKRFYIGFTSNPEARISHHNHPKNHGWTAKFKPWIMIYSESHESKEEAMKREKQLKSARGREYIKSVINSL